MGKFLVGLLAQLGSNLFGLLGGALGGLKNAIGEAKDEMLQYNQRAIAFGRQMGMSLKESQTYSEVLVSRAKEFGKAYGIAAEEVFKIQENLSKATGKALMLNDAQAETIVQINKLVGSDVFDQFTSEMMNSMGAQLSAVQGAVSKAYASAAKSGLNAQKVSEKVAQNLSMANRLSFRDGVNGLTRMAIQAEKLGISMQSVEAAAKSFIDLDKAIENSARLQMLGGSAAVAGGNPLTMAYEANYDPEAFAKRMSDTLASYATFDKNKGYATINGMNMDFVRNIAKAMGISEEDAVKNAKKQSEVKYKEGAFGSALGQYNQEQRDFILNKSYVENGRLMINDVNGNKHDISNGKLPENMLNEMMKFADMDDSELMRQQALSLTSIDETVKGYKTSFTATIAEPIVKRAEEIQTLIKGWGEMAINNIAKPLRGKLEKFLDMITDENGFLASLNNFAKSWTGGFFKTIINNLEWILGAVLAYKAVKWGKGAFDLGKSLLGGGGGGGAAANGVRGIKNAWSNVRNYGRGSKFWDAALGRVTKDKAGNYRATNKGFGTHFVSKNFGRFASGLKVGTAALGAVTGVIQGVGAVSEYNRRKEEINNSNMSQAEKDKALNEARIDKNTEVGGAVGAGVGTVLGTFFFGPLGGMIGGAVGEFAGKFIGQYWDPIVDTVFNLCKKVGSGIVWLGGKIWDGITWLVDNNPIGLIVKGIGKIFGKDLSITKGISSGIDAIKGWFGGGEKHAEGGIVGGTSTNGDKVVTRLNSGEMVLNVNQQTALFNFIKRIPNMLGSVQTTNNTHSNMMTSIVSSILTNNNDVKAIPVGNKEYIYTPNRSETSNVNGNTVTVKDFNINLNGTIKLDGGNNSKDIDVAALLNDYQFMNSLKEMIKDSINRDMSGGRRENNFFTLRNHPSVGSVYGH